MYILWQGAAFPYNLFASYCFILFSSSVLQIVLCNCPSFNGGYWEKVNISTCMDMVNLLTKKVRFINHIYCEPWRSSRIHEIDVCSQELRYPNFIYFKQDEQRKRPLFWHSNIFIFPFYTFYTVCYWFLFQHYTFLIKRYFQTDKSNISYFYCPRHTTCWLFGIWTQNDLCQLKCSHTSSQLVVIQKIIRMQNAPIITGNNRKIDVDVVALVNRFYTSSVKCWTANFCIYAIKNPVIIVNQLKYINNSSFKDSYPDNW